MRTITAKMLEDAKACPGQVRLFRKLFGEKAKVTVKNCRKAAAAGLDLDWLLLNLLPESAWAAYEAAVDPKAETFVSVITEARRKRHLSKISWEEYEDIWSQSLYLLGAVRAKAFYAACRGAKRDTK